MEICQLSRRACSQHVHSYEESYYRQEKEAENISKFKKIEAGEMDDG